MMFIGFFVWLMNTSNFYLVKYKKIKSVPIVYMPSKTRKATRKASALPHNQEAVLFVMYKMGTGGSWAYKLPKGWWWVGSGSTASAAHPNEEQFQGPPTAQASVKAYLNKFFGTLKKKGIVERYKLRTSYAS